MGHHIVKYMFVSFHLFIKRMQCYRVNYELMIFFIVFNELFHRSEN